MENEEVKSAEQQGPTIEERQQAFLKEYGELVEKHNIDFATYPVFVPSQSEPGAFKVVVQNTPVDISNAPKKSPFVAQ